MGDKWRLFFALSVTSLRGPASLRPGGTRKGVEVISQLGMFVKIQRAISRYSYSSSCVLLDHAKEYRNIIPKNFSSTLSLTLANLCDKGLMFSQNAVVLSLIETEEQVFWLPCLSPFFSPHPTAPSGSSCCPHVGVPRLRSQLQSLLAV